MGVLGSDSTVHGIQMLGKCDVFLMAWCLSEQKGTSHRKGEERGGLSEGHAPTFLIYIYQTETRLEYNNSQQQSAWTVFILPHSAYRSWCQTCKGLFTQSKDLLVMCNANATATAKARRPVVDWSLFIKIVKGFTSMEAPNILETSTHWQITSITHTLMVILYHCVKSDPFLSMLMWELA